MSSLIQIALPVVNRLLRQGVATAIFLKRGEVFTFVEAEELAAYLRDPRGWKRRLYARRAAAKRWPDRETI
jgi:hypothetical protein